MAVCLWLVSEDCTVLAVFVPALRSSPYVTSVENDDAVSRTAMEIRSSAVAEKMYDMLVKN